MYPETEGYGRRDERHEIEGRDNSLPVVVSSRLGDGDGVAILEVPQQSDFQDRRNGGGEDGESEDDQQG